MKINHLLKQAMVFLRRLTPERTLKRLESETTISEQQQNMLAMLDNSKDVIYHFQIKPEWKFIYLSPAIDLWLGEGTAEAAMKDPSVPFQLVHPDDLAEMMDKVSNEVDYGDMLIQRWKDQDGIYHWFEERITPIYENDELVALQGVTRNIDERMEQQRRLEYQANYDALTDIHNRAFFNEIIEQLNVEVSTPAGMILCDVDRLKMVNDQFGHEAGDELLKRVARYLTRFSDHDTTIARIGGDEFIILITGENAHHHLQELDEVMAKELEDYNGIHPEEEIHLSIGSAYTGNSIGCMSQLFRQADAEMYRNKAEKRQKRIDRNRSVPV
ncbi:sensor domain-containing diguanylate cyclase [Sporosarcina gallistercoris]|uniref:Diguanylate cyclase n=1 Tax=Sporosarcina gallistercoris TaxID=2762245 RepID=A0ABR8PM40_9BACL|nr:diguanylate cyclase [Sporosarcina gallistercoris]MBD7909244.1 diguanylate cyclase [Sporosarcina gallistercoris]